MDILKKIYSRIAIYLRLRGSKALFFAAVVLTVLFINGPFITGNGYVQFHQTEGVLHVGPEISTVALQFDTEVNVINYSIQKVAATAAVGESVASVLVKLDKNVEMLPIAIPKELSSAAGSESLAITVVFDSAVPVKLVKAYIGEKEMPVKLFYDKYVRGDAAYMTVRFIREDIAVLVVNLNDSIANYVMTFMVVILIFSVGQALSLGWPLSFTSNKVFEKFIHRKCGTAGLVTVESLEKFALEHLALEPGLKFQQALGPAVGLALTVSSLIAALQPHTKNSSNVSAFMDSLHVAMISTLLGLGIRIGATFSRRFIQKLIARADSMYETLSMEDFWARYKMS
jgi:hypothetical protein